MYKLTTAWAYAELLGRPGLEAMTKAALKSRINIGKLLTAISDDDKKVIRDGDVLYLRDDLIKNPMLYESLAEMTRWQKLLECLYGMPSVRETQVYYRIYPLTEENLMSMSFD